MVCFILNVSINWSALMVHSDFHQLWGGRCEVVCLSDQSQQLMTSCLVWKCVLLFVLFLINDMIDKGKQKWFISNMWWEIPVTWHSIFTRKKTRQSQRLRTRWKNWTIHAQLNFFDSYRWNDAPDGAHCAIISWFSSLLLEASEQRN